MRLKLPWPDHFVLLCFFVCLLVPRVGLSAAGYLPQVPNDPSRLEFYLHTVEVGDQVWNNFGHDAIRVVNPEEGTDLVYNWGIFDFSNPFSFAFTFYKGILIYQLGIYPFATAQRIYRAEGRTVWEDRLLLDTEQKLRLMERLAFQAQPENRPYRYLYFADNCSTRPRDYIDEASNGAVGQVAKDHLTGESYRDMVRSHYASIPFVRLSLDLLMNRRIDQEMSLWDKMFLPKTLRAVLLTASVPSKDGGSPRPLLEEGRKLADTPAPQPYPSFVDRLILLVFAAPLLLAGVSLRHSPASRAKGPIPKILLRTAGLTGLILAILAGTYGVMMPLTWAFSEHLDLHHNANMLLFWPMDYLLAVPAATWLFRGRPWQGSARAVMGFRAFAVLHLALTAVQLLLVQTQGVTQHVDLVWQVLAPCNVALWLLVLRRGVALAEAQP